MNAYLLFDEHHMYAEKLSQDSKELMGDSTIIIKRQDNTP